MNNAVHNASNLVFFSVSLYRFLIKIVLIICVKCLSKDILHPKKIVICSFFRLDLRLGKREINKAQEIGHQLLYA